MPRNENAVFYQLFLQTPEAEAALGRDLHRTFRPASLPAWVTESDSMFEFTRSGFRGPLSWWRNIDRG